MKRPTRSTSCIIKKGRETYRLIANWRHRPGWTVQHMLPGGVLYVTLAAGVSQAEATEVMEPLPQGAEVTKRS